MFRKARKVGEHIPCQIMKPGLYETSSGLVELLDDSKPWLVSPETAKELKRAGAIRYIKPSDFPETYRNL